MGYIPIDRIVRSAIANKGYATLHKYVPYLHWAFKGLEKFQSEGYYPNVRVTRDNVDENNCLPFPEDMMMWNKLGIVSNGVLHVFVNNDSLSLLPSDHGESANREEAGLFAYSSGALSVLYTTNIYVSTQDGVVTVNAGARNSFKANWEANKFQIDGAMGDQEVYLEYIAKAFNPTEQTLVNELGQEYIEDFITYREARYKFGAAHRETMAAEREWLNSEDTLAENMSDLTAKGLLRALTGGTRRAIDQ